MVRNTDRGDYMYHESVGATPQNRIPKPRGYNALGVLLRLSANNPQLSS